jgi:short-subunit dehydrogenase
MELRGKTVWLVGASEGIGRATAIEFAKRGAVVYVSARQKDKLDALVAELPGQGHRAIACDVTDVESVKQAFAAAAQPTAPDMVIYAAGTYAPMGAKDWKLDTTLHTLDVNLNGALRVINEALPAMLARRSGTVVIMSSVAAYRGLPKSMGYGASKAALTNLAESMRIDLHGTGVDVKLVSPGFVKTRLTDQNDFKMPNLITPERAARYIADGMEKDHYDIHFPPAFSWFMKLMRILPNRLYFAIARSL